MSTKRFSAVLTIGGALAGSLSSALGTATSKFGHLGDVIRKLEREQALLTQKLRDDPYARAGFGETLGKLQLITKELEKQHRIVSARAGITAGKERMAGAAAGLGIVGAIAGAAAFPIIQAAQFETAMLGVAKQVDGARDASGHLTAVYFDMKKQIQDLGHEMPMATSEIAAMAAAGARMGIARGELVEFTRTAGMMAEAFELPAGELAEQMGKIRTLFGLKTQGEVRALADAVNYLDDNAISKGGDIIEFLQRTGGVASSVKITGQQMAALGSTMLTLGTTTHVAGTAVNAIFQKLGAAEKGTKKFRGAMSELGLSLKEVQSGMQVDAQGTLLKVLDKIRAMPKDKQLGAMVDLVGLEHSDELAKLASGVAEYRKQIALAGSQKAEGSMSREFQARMGTTAAQFELTKNRAGELGEKIGSVLLPSVNELLPKLGEIVTKTADWVGGNRTLVGDLATLVAGLTTGYAAFSLFAGGIGAVTFAFNALKLAWSTHPIMIAATLLGTAALLIYKNWEPIKDFFSGLWISITEGATKAFEWVVGKFDWFGDKYKQFKSWIAEAAVPGGVNRRMPSFQAPSLPQVPETAAARGMNVTGQQTNNFTINQQPGQNAAELARVVAEELKKRKAVSRSSSMLDPVGAF